jgi:hypothetical protein
LSFPTCISNTGDPGVCPRVRRISTIAIFAGDIAASPREAVDILLTQPALAERPIVYVPGNHEFHGGEIEARLSEGRAATVGTRVNLLDRETVVINGARLIGAVLWTDYDFFPGISDEAMIHASKALEDHRAIRIGEGSRSLAFTPAEALARHTRPISPISRANWRGPSPAPPLS